MTDPTVAKDYRASDDPNWQPWTKNDGTVVTLTPDHCDAIYQALQVYKRVAKPPVFDVDAAIGILGFLRAKSCLMGRLLYEGKPPLVDAPPLVMAAPDYSLEVPRVAHRHLAEPVDVVAQAIRVADGQHKMGAGRLSEVVLKALREAGYTLMQPCCEACDDDGISW